MSVLTNYKAVHIALVAAALVVVVLRNHGILSVADVDAAVAALGSLGVGLNINLSGTTDKAAVEQAAKDIEAIEVPKVAPPTTPTV